MTYISRPVVMFFKLSVMISLGVGCRVLPLWNIDRDSGTGSCGLLFIAVGLGGFLGLAFVDF